MDVEQRLRNAESDASIARGQAANVEIFRQATENGIHRLSGETIDLRRDLDNHMMDTRIMDDRLAGIEADCGLMLPTAMFILNGVGQGYMESGFGMKASDENPDNTSWPGYYKITLERPTKTYCLCVTPIWAGVDWANETGNVGVVWLNNREFKITCFSSIHDATTKRPYKLSIIVW